MNKFMKLIFFLNSQLIFLLGLTLGCLFFEQFDYKYLTLFGFYFLILIIPFIYFVYILKNTLPDKFNVETFDIKNMPKNNLIFSIFGIVFTILGWGINFFGQNLNLNSFFQISWFSYVYLPIGIIIVLLIYFFFHEDSKEYFIFNNILLINFLKYRIIEIKNREGNVKYLLTRKSVKKNELITGIKHLFGGIYYY